MANSSTVKYDLNNVSAPVELIEPQSDDDLEFSTELEGFEVTEHKRKGARAEVVIINIDSRQVETTFVHEVRLFF